MSALSCHIIMLSLSCNIILLEYCIFCVIRGTSYTDNYLSLDVFLNSLVKAMFVNCTIYMFAIEIKFISILSLLNYNYHFHYCHTSTTWSVNTTTATNVTTINAQTLD